MRNRFLFPRAILPVLWLCAAAGLYGQSRSAEDYYRSLPVYKILVDEGRPGGPFWMFFRSGGNPQGRTLVLLHGINAAGYSYAPLAQELGRDFRLIIVDLPAYGNSYVDRPIDYSYEAMMPRLVALLRGLNALRGAVFIGHSTGGALAWHLSLEKDSGPAGLVLIDAITVDYSLAGKPGLAFSLARAYRLMGPLFNLVGPRTIAGIVAAASTERGFRPSRQSLQWDAVMYTTPGRLRVNAGWVSQLLDFEIVRSWAPRLREIAVPTLLLWGRKDAVLELALMDRAKASIPGSQGVVLEGAGHSPHPEKPREVAALIRDFAASLPAAEEKPRFGAEIRPAEPDEIRDPPPEDAGSLYHVSLSLSHYRSGGFLDSASIHLKRGYFSTEYPSQSGSLGFFLEALGKGSNLSFFAGGQIELVWFKAGGIRLAAGWKLSRDPGPGTLLKIGYVPSYLPWLCLGARWLGGDSKAGFFVTLELAPLLHKAFLFW